MMHTSQIIGKTAAPLFLFLTTLISVTATAQKTNCNTVDCIKNALAVAKAGDEIIIAPGVYSPIKKTEDAIGNLAAFTSDGDGTSSSPIILRGASSTNKPILRSELKSYILSITGNYWVIRDIEFSGGLKGIMLDEANNCQLIALEVHEIDQEGVHFRSGSSNNIIKDCAIYETGLVNPGIGEGIYVGSDRNQHEIDGVPKKKKYNPFCNNNIIKNNSIGPNVRAEGIDVKEGTSGTIIRNNTFSAKGISGDNSADAFIDLKGATTFVYNNTFDVDGSTVLITAIDFQQRPSESIPDQTTGYRNAIFDNTFKLGSAAIPTLRKRGGSPIETHLWNNIRIPASDDFPTSTGTESIVTTSCPNWNIVSCENTLSNATIEPATTSVKLYPNPVKDHLYVTGLPSTNTTASVLTLQGQLICSINGMQTKTQGITLANLTEGMYILKIEGASVSNAILFQKK